jgi:2-C-methyl-D-erythritol 4-phosphate cytidylyltransferase
MSGVRAGGERSPRAGPWVGVAVPAAGSGRRMGGVRKPFLELAGEPVLLHALRPFLADERVVSVSVALGDEDASDPPIWLTEVDSRVRVVAGGATRGESVRLAMAALPDDVTVIAVHDAARPLVTEAVVRACIDIAATGIGAVAGCPAVDTMKTVDGDARIVSTADRSTLWHAHTPQVFPAEVLLRAYAEGGGDATDDAALVERAGGVVRMVDGGPLNMKVTRPGDVARAEAILQGRDAHDV